MRRGLGWLGHLADMTRTFSVTFLFLYPVQNFIPQRDLHVGVGCIGGGLNLVEFFCYLLIHFVQVVEWFEDDDWLGIQSG